MKHYKKTIAFSLIGLVGFTSTGCFGSFELTKKIYDWNDSVTENKFVKTLLFYGMAIIQVYSIGIIVDSIIFNLIEFWDGTNPLAMNEGDCEERFYAHKGVNYRAVATKDQLEFTALDGKNAGEVQVMRFDRETLTWFYENGDQTTALMSFEGENAELLKVYTPNGETIQFVANPNASGDVCDMYMPTADFGTYALKD